MRASKTFGGIFDFDTKSTRLKEVNAELEDASVWNDPKHAQDLGREKKALEDVVTSLESLQGGIQDARDLMEMALAEEDFDTVAAVETDADSLRERIEALEFRRMFANPADPSNCPLKLARCPSSMCTSRPLTW